MAKNLVASQSMFVNEFGAAEYELNGMRSNREDFNAVTLTRIASALEQQVLLMQEEEEEGGEEGGTPEGESKPPTRDNMFGI